MYVCNKQEIYFTNSEANASEFVKYIYSNFEEIVVCTDTDGKDWDLRFLNERKEKYEFCGIPFLLKLTIWEPTCIWINKLVS